VTKQAKERAESAKSTKAATASPSVVYLPIPYRLAGPRTRVKLSGRGKIVLEQGVWPLRQHAIQIQADMSLARTPIPLFLVVADCLTPAYSDSGRLRLDVPSAPGLAQRVLPFSVVSCRVADSSSSALQVGRTRFLQPMVVV